MKKAFIIFALLMVLSGVLSFLQYKKIKPEIDAIPVLLEPIAEVEVDASAASSGGSAAAVPVFDGSCG